MALVVEDGTGLATATGYISVAFFRDFAGVEALDLTGILDPAIENAIQRATRYQDTRFRFIGFRKVQTQRLEWPRVDAYYHDGRLADGVPIEMQESCGFYTFRALSARLAPDPVYDASGGRVVRKLERAGPITRETEFGMSGVQVTFRKYPEADRRIKELVTTGRRLARA